MTAAALAPVVGFLEAHPAVLPVLVALLVLAVPASAPLARRLGCGRLAAGLLLLACTAPLGMTLLPSDGYDSSRVAGCVTALKRPAEWGRGGEELANLALLAPAGLLLVLLLPRRALLLVLPVALVLPLAVEGAQLVVTWLQRQCEATDVVLNLLGLLVGAGAGLLLRLSRPRPARGPRPSASPGT